MRSLLSRIVPAFLLGMTALLDSRPVPAAEPSLARILYPGGARRIPELILKSAKVHRERDPTTGKEHQIATIDGTFVRPNSKLIFGKDTVVLLPGGAFRVVMPVIPEHNIATFHAVDVRGKTVTEKLSIFLPLSATPVLPKPRRLNFSVGVGLSSIQYQELGVPDVSEVAVTSKFLLNFPINSRISTGGSAFLTVATLKSSSEAKLRFLGINARVTYQFTEPANPWRFSLATGWYLTSTLVSGGDFGFSAMAGPQIFPSLQRTFNRGDYLSGYFKASAVSTGAETFSPGNHELAGGLTYGFPSRTQNRFITTLDYAVLAFKIEDITVKSTSLTLGVGYMF